MKKIYLVVMIIFFTGLAYLVNTHLEDGPALKRKIKIGLGLESNPDVGKPNPLFTAMSKNKGYQQRELAYKDKRHQLKSLESKSVVLLQDESDILGIDSKHVNQLSTRLYDLGSLHIVTKIEEVVIQDDSGFGQKESFDAKSTAESSWYASKDKKEWIKVAGFKHSKSGVPNPWQSVPTGSVRYLKNEVLLKTSLARRLTYHSIFRVWGIKK